MILPLLLAISVFTFVMLHLAPGDPIAAMAGLDPERMDPETVARRRAELGLDDPLPVQYFRYLGGVVQGDLGRSISSNRSVSAEIAERFPVTMQLAVATMLVVIVIGIPLGVISARYNGSWIDNAAMALGLFGVSMPNFWVGIMLILIFSLYLGWLPSVGRGDTPIEMLRSLILPALTLGTSLAGLVTRITRSSMLEVLNQDYVRTARSKGLSENGMLIRHALRNAMIPLLTILGLQFASLLSGTVIIETIFAWPGMGRFVVNAIWRRDYPVIMGCVLVFATIFMIVNLVIDILYAVADPRVRY
jgi:peptide/nickel transport system permease protein